MYNLENGNKNLTGKIICACMKVLKCVGASKKWIYRCINKLMILNKFVSFLLQKVWHPTVCKIFFFQLWDNESEEPFVFLYFTTHKTSANKIYYLKKLLKNVLNGTVFRHRPIFATYVLVVYLKYKTWQSKITFI